MKNRNKISKKTWPQLSKLLTIYVIYILVSITVASLLFNMLTSLPQTLPAQSGKSLTASGIRVHYQQWGTHGVPIVLVPGFLESTVSWQSVAPLLAKNHVVYALDLAGYGYTQFDGKYSLADEVQLVNGFIHTTHLIKPIVVGHSLGAAVVGDLALLHPNYIGGVIFADGDGLPLKSHASILRTLFVDSPYFTSMYRILLDTRNLDLSVFKNICGPQCPAATPQLLKQWLRPLHQAQEENAIEVTIKNGLSGITPQQISAIKVPRAIIWGQYDRNAGGSLQDAIDSLHHPETKIIANAGHLSMLANPVAFAAAVEAVSGNWQ